MLDARLDETIGEVQRDRQRGNFSMYLGVRGVGGATPIAPAAWIRKD